MELRSSRSRSKTPFVLDSFDETGGNFMTMEGRKTVTTRSSKRVQKSNNISQESMLEEEYSINARHVKPTRRSSRAKTFIKTSDYSSEDNEDNEVSSSSRMISENAKNKILEDAKLAAGTNTGVTALGLYRRAKRYWDEYPKTDWTYSPFSKDRVEIAPGVVAMPNMSRRAIHSYEMSEKGTNTDSATYTSLKPTRLFSSTQANNNYYKTTQQRSIFRRIVTSVLTIVTMFFLSITSTISYGYWGFHHVAVWLAKKVHHLTSKVMLLDTWLLRSNSYGGNKTRRVLLLCLLPLLLIGGFHLTLLLLFGHFASSCFPNCSSLETFYFELESMKKYFAIKA